MQSEAILRRRDLLLAGGGLAASACATLPALAAQPSNRPATMTGFTPGPIQVKELEFATVEQELRALLRVQCSLEPVDTPAWGHWTAYVVVPGSPPLPVVDFEGMELTRAVRRGDGSYFVRGIDVSYARDHRTGTFVATVRNPVTGETVDAPTNVLDRDPGAVVSPTVGWWHLQSPKPARPDLHTRWWQEGDRGRLRREQSSPPGSSHSILIASQYEFPLAAFHDSSVPSLPYRSGGIYTFPFPAWMRMGDRPGHMLGMTSGQKLRSVRDLPREFLERTEREHPELLSLDAFFRSVPSP